jgi:hypothetical protein
LSLFSFWAADSFFISSKLILPQHKPWKSIVFRSFKI